MGEILATTALAELYLDGNSLRCEGALELIKPIVENCEAEAVRKEIEEREKREEEERRLAEGNCRLFNKRFKFYTFIKRILISEAAKPVWERQAVQAEPAKEQKEEDGKDKKKKKKKKKSKMNLYYIFASLDANNISLIILKEKKKSDEPPKVGAFVCKLHLADNEIDWYEEGKDKAKSVETLQQTIEMFTK